MLGCKIQIQLGNETLSFNSQEELDDFVKRNYNRIQSAIKNEISPVRFSKNPTNFEKQDEAFTKLSDLKAQQSASISYEIDGTKYEVVKTSVNVKGVRGVTGFINTLKDVNDRDLFTKFNVDNYITVMTDQFTAKYMQEEGLSEIEARAKATDTIDKEVKSWPLMSSLGTEIHDAASMFFDNNITDFDAFRQLYARKLEGGNHVLTPIVLRSLYDVFDNLRNEIVNVTGDPNVKFITEVPIINEGAGLVGIVDLIGITSDGFAYVADFKTSFKYVDDQDRDKRKKYGYQLAFYKRLLESTGIPVKDLSIIPIKLDSVDKDFTKITSIEVEKTLSKIIELTEPTADENIRARTLIEAPELEYLKFQDSGIVEQEQKDFFNISPKDDLDAQVARFKEKAVYKEGDRRYFFDGRNRNYLKEVKVNPSTQAEMDANFLNERLNDSIIREHIMKMNSSKYESIANYKTALKRMMVTGEMDVMSMLDPYASDAVIENTLNTFSHYVTGGYTILDIPELESHGVIAFKNNIGNYVDFVAITSQQDLNQLIPLSKGRNMLGEFRSDKQVERERYLMESNVANHLGIKILSVLNQNVDLFNSQNLSINNIQIYSNTNAQQIPLIKSNLLSNYKLLLKETGGVYNLNGIKFADAAQELLFATTIAIRRGTTNNVSANRLLTTLNRVLGATDVSNAKMVEELRQVKDKFERELKFSWNKTIDFNSDMGLVYGFLNKLILELSSNKVDYTNEDMVDIGGSDSRLFSSYHEVKNQVAQVALMPIRTAMSTMSENYIKLNNKFRPIFKKFYEAKGVSAMLGNHQYAFDNLYEKDAQGKLDPRFRFKNPSANLGDHSYLDSAERAFLNEILPELGKRMYGEMGVANAQMTGDYYNVPLKRASQTSKLLEGGITGIGSSFVNSWSNFVNSALEENYLFDDSERSTVNDMSKELKEMYNKFNISKNPGSRQRVLDSQDLIEFEKNVEAIFADVVYTDMKTNAYNNALPIVTATIVTSMLQQQKLGNHNLEMTYRYIADNIKATVYNEKLIEEHQRKTLEVGGTIKHAVSMLQLGMSPLNLIRETLQGQWATISKLAAKQYGDETPSIEDYRWALGKIMGEGREFMKNVTLTEELNHMYRMAGMDVDQLAEKMVVSKTGLSQINNRWWLWFMGAPDYLNRMAFLLAKMKKDGSYEAHTMKDEVLSYDWKKDERFSIYASGATSDPKYNEQRGKYLAYLEQFNKEARQSGTNVVDLVEGDDLPKAYPTIERESMKAFVNYMHGPYDAEDKIMFNNTMFGVMLMQFRTWLLAKKQQYYMKAGRYAMGRFKHVSNESGEPLYVKDLDNGDREITTEDTGVPLYDWEGRFMEGVWQSFMRVKDELIKGDGLAGAWDLIRNDENVKSNAIMSAMDMGFFMLIAVGFPAIIPWDELKDEKWLTSVLNMIGQSAADLFIWNNVESMINVESMFPAITYLYDQIDGFISLITGQRDIGKFVARSTGFTRFLDKTTDIFEEVKEK